MPSSLDERTRHGMAADSLFRFGLIEKSLLNLLFVLITVFWSYELRAQKINKVSQQHTHSFRMNTVGYLPDSTKQVTISEPQKRFKVTRLFDRKVVLEGVSSAGALNTDTKEELSTIDLSAVREPGTYQIEVDGLDLSPTFKISSDVFNHAFLTVVRGMYLTRCGIAVSGKHGEEVFSHDACHLHDAHTDFVADSGEKKDASGGWHDAGDYNKYVVNAGVTVGMMLHGWEHFGDRLGSLKLDLPESGNDIPDYLDEIRWEMDWVLKTQLVDGSVSHKISTKKFGGFIAPEKELKDRYFVPWGSAATADFVAMAAETSRVFQKYDEAYAAKCLAAAKRSYQFLIDHPQDHPADQTGFSTGGYGASDVDDRLWAAAELWQTTGESAYLKDLEDRLREMAERQGSENSVVDLNWDWGDVSNLGMFTYALSDRAGRNPELLARVKRDIVQVADEIVAASKSHGYARPLGNRYYWGCNGTVARLAMNLHVADLLQPNTDYKRTTLAAIDHLLGRNFNGRSYVTGIGFEPPRFPHDRRNGINGSTNPWPGYLVGGAWPTARDWHDDQEDYRTNEIAINWNGALIYALAGFVEPETFNVMVPDANAP